MNDAGNSQALVSVVIPAYKAEHWIAETLSSVRAQTYPNLEIIVVDDGSPDNLQEVVRSIATADSRVQLLQQKNGGVGSARNHGIRKAAGKYIAILDADDLWRPDKIEKQVSCFETHAANGANVGMVYCWSQIIDEQSEIIRLGLPRKAKQGQIFNELLVENFIGNGSSPLILKSAFELAGYFMEDRTSGCEDWALYLCVAYYFEVFAVEEYLVGYRRFEGSMSTNITRMIEAHDAMSEEVLNKCEDVDKKLLMEGRIGLLLWLLSVSKPFSCEFRQLVSVLFEADPLFFLLRVTLSRSCLMLSSRVRRLMHRTHVRKQSGHFLLRSNS